MGDRSGAVGDKGDRTGVTGTAGQLACRLRRRFAALYDFQVAHSWAAAHSCLQQAGAAVVLLQCDGPLSEAAQHFLQRLQAQHPQVTRIAMGSAAASGSLQEAVDSGLLQRAVCRPCGPAKLGELLHWATQQASLCGPLPAYQKRLLQHERLATLGGLSASLLHDLQQPVAYMAYNAALLQRLAAQMPALAERLAHPLPPAPATDCLQPFAELTQDLGAIASDLQAGCDLLLGLTEGTRQLLRTRDTGPLLPHAVPHAAPPTPPQAAMAAIRFALRVCRGVALQHRAKLVYRGPRLLQGLPLSPGELSQLLINLLTNAAQAHAAGGTPRPLVMLQVAARGPWLHVAVLDNGRGMPPEVLRQVGTPYFTTRAQGTGLGLAQCRRVAERWGGSLHLNSQVGVGTKVSLCLPLT
jgi:signal transduction histidine kinase